LRIWPYLQWSLAVIFTFAAIELLYVLAPNVPLAHRLTVPGAVVATSFLLLLSWGLGYYFHLFGQLKLDKFYGALASPFALFMWMKWGAAAVLVGAEVNVNLQRRKTSSLSGVEQVVERTKGAA
jgi:YihY family inner membrane protein